MPNGPIPLAEITSKNPRLEFQGTAEIITSPAGYQCNFSFPIVRFPLLIKIAVQDLVGRAIPANRDDAYDSVHQCSAGRFSGIARVTGDAF